MGSSIPHRPSFRPNLRCPEPQGERDGRQRGSAFDRDRPGQGHRNGRNNRHMDGARPREVGFDLIGFGNTSL